MPGSHFGLPVTDGRGRAPHRSEVAQRIDPLRQRRDALAPVKGTDGRMPRNAFRRISCPRSSRSRMAFEHDLRWFCSKCPCPVRRGRCHSPFASTSSEKVPAARVATGKVLSEPSVGNPQTRQTDVCSPHLPFSTSTCVSYSYRCSLGRTSLLRIDGTTKKITVGPPASAGRPVCIGTRRFLPRPTGPAEPLTLRHHAGGWSTQLQLSSGTIEVGRRHRFPWCRDGVPNQERLLPSGTPRGLHHGVGLSPGPSDLDALCSGSRRR